MSEIPLLYKKIVVDIDGTLCENTNGKNYPDAPPKFDVIAKVNQYWHAGYHVTIFTARGMNIYSGDLTLIEKNLRPITEAWLLRHGVQYDRLLFGKPPSDMYIDDKGITPDEFCRTRD
jgi:capsule biosynthesis phosphatase